VDEIMFLNGEAFGRLEVFDAIAVGPLTMGEEKRWECMRERREMGIRPTRRLSKPRLSWSVA
jgi:hypothetical protein